MRMKAERRRAIPTVWVVIPAWQRWRVAQPAESVHSVAMLEAQALEAQALEAQARGAQALEAQALEAQALEALEAPTRAKQRQARAATVETTGTACLVGVFALPRPARERLAWYACHHRARVCDHAPRQARTSTAMAKSTSRSPTWHIETV